MNKTRVLFLIVFCLFFLNTASAETIFTYRASENPKDIRFKYDRAVLELALGKTIKPYGPYKLVPSQEMSITRAQIMAESGKIPNFFCKLSVSKERMDSLGHVPFPVDRGIVGYRVFFVAPDAEKRLKQITSLEQLKEFTIGQRLGWNDVNILKQNGFQVKTGDSYEMLFKMIAKGRFDLFPRGANEILSEFKSHTQINGLVYNKSISLYYPLPRFFFTAQSNTLAIKRIEHGLVMADKDGSLEKIWNKYYGPSMNFVNLKDRKIFRINNPELNGFDTSWEKYIYNP